MCDTKRPDGHCWRSWAIAASYAARTSVSLGGVPVARKSADCRENPPTDWSRNHFGNAVSACGPKKFAACAWPARRSAVVTLILRRRTSRSTTSCVTTCVSQIVLPPDLMVPSVAAISFFRLGLSAIADSWRSTESRERSFPFTVSADGRTALQLAATAPIAAIATSATGTRTSVLTARRMLVARLRRRAPARRAVRRALRRRPPPFPRRGSRPRRPALPRRRARAAATGSSPTPATRGR